jgi:hypothetical protein
MGVVGIPDPVGAACVPTSLAPPLLVLGSRERSRFVPESFRTRAFGPESSAKSEALIFSQVFNHFHGIPRIGHSGTDVLLLKSPYTLRKKTDTLPVAGRIHVRADYANMRECSRVSGKGSTF